MKKIIRYLIYLFIFNVAIVTILTFSYDKNITIPDYTLGKHIEVDGVKLRVHQIGQGPDILFIHGSIGNLEDFEAVLPYLENYRVTLFDRIGHGYSAMSPQKANIKNNALFTSALIKKLSLKNVTVVGHSYGGSIALKLALNKDPNIRSLILLAPAVYSLSPTSKLEHLLSKPLIGMGLLRLFRPFIAEQQLRQNLQVSLKPNQPQLPDGFINTRIKLWNNPGTLHTRTQQTSEVSAELEEMKSHYSEIKLPVTIFIGDKEQHKDIAQGCYLLEKNLPNIKLFVIQDAGHYLQYKNPEQISKAIMKAAIK